MTTLFWSWTGSWPMIDRKKSVRPWSTLRHAASSRNMMDLCSHIWINLVGICKLDSLNHFVEHQSLLNSHSSRPHYFDDSCVRSWCVCVFCCRSIVCRNWTEKMSQPDFMNFYIFDNTLCQFLTKSSFETLYIFMGCGYLLPYSQ